MRVSFDTAKRVSHCQLCVTRSLNSHSSSLRLRQEYSIFLTDMVHGNSLSHCVLCQVPTSCM